MFYYMNFVLTVFLPFFCRDIFNAELNIQNITFVVVLHKLEAHHHDRRRKAITPKIEKQNDLKKSS